jgi:hypothetical protein
MPKSLKPKPHQTVTHPNKIEFESPSSRSLADILPDNNSLKVINDVKATIQTNLGHPNLALLDKYLDDDLLFRRHFDLLEGKIHIKKYDPKTGELMEEYDQCDFGAVAKALQMAYSIKGYFANDAIKMPDNPLPTNQINIQMNFEKASDEEIDNILKKCVK